jgi:predicted DNA-binding protein
MATLLVKDVPDELYTAFSKLAAQKGLTLEEAVNEAIEKYVESFSVEARLEQISNRIGISIDPAEISNIIKDERNKR